jgi:uncharacterized protein (UPF0261 family)
MAGPVLIIGALDTKGAEHAFVRDRIRSHGLDVLVMDTSVLGEPRGDIQADIPAARIAEAAGTTLEALRSSGDRGAAMSAMAAGAAVVARQLHDEGRFAGAIGLGGTGGSSVISAAMREMPIGLPKVLVSTAASGDTRAMIGTKDIVLVPSVVDVAGINRISRLVLTEAADAIAGMVGAPAAAVADDRPVVTISMFGNTTKCVEACQAALQAEGYETLVFHCTGVGGATMESLVADGLVAGVLDITTTEWADELCGGVFSAGPTRLDAPGALGIPHVVVPGCLDMVNFGPREEVPAKYDGRKFHIWNPTVTLMRTDPDENRRLGEIIGEKINRAQGPVGVLIPLRGVSILDSDGNDFWWPEADQALFSALRATVRPGIPFREIDANINDEAFSAAAVEMFRQLMAARN